MNENIITQLCLISIKPTTYFFFFLFSLFAPFLRTWLSGCVRKNPKYRSLYAREKSSFKMFSGSGEVPKHLAKVAKQEEKEYKDGIRKLVSKLSPSSVNRVSVEFLSSSAFA